MVGQEQSSLNTCSLKGHSAAWGRGERSGRLKTTVWNSAVPGPGKGWVARGLVLKEGGRAGTPGEPAVGRPRSWGLTHRPCSLGTLSQAFLPLPCLVSFLPLQASAWLTSSGRVPLAPVGPASVPDPRLLLPGDLTGTRPGPGSETAGVCLRSAGTASTRAPPGTWPPCTQPGPSQESGRDQACSPVAMGHTNLEAELEDIQRQLQDYQSMKQNLR